MKGNSSELINEELKSKKKSFLTEIRNEFITIEIKNAISKMESLNLTEFDKEASNIFFSPISCKENYSGNYDNYVRKTLTHISSFKNLHYEKALSNPELYENYPEKEISECLKSNKKLLLLDLDETLIHSEYDLKDKNINSYDTVLRFKDNSYDKNSFDGSNSDEYCEVGIILRNGVKKFLSILNNYFNIGIFTASVKEYADAIIRYLDPNKNIFKFCLYRNNCVNVNDLVNIKDLRIIKDVDLKKIILVDNNMYSFSTQLSNGILINSFYGDKDDDELMNVLGYLIQFIFSSDDVRVTNENVFGFKRIAQQME